MSELQRIDQARVRVDQARWWALNHQPFYGSLAMNLSVVIDPSTGTAHTDGRSIHWNPDFVEKLTDPELRFVNLHETLHCAHQHLWRLPPTEKGNVAGDHEINLTLTAKNPDGSDAIPGISMPEGGLADPQYKDLSCEEIFARLPDEDPDDDDDDDDAGSQPDGDESQDEQSGGDKLESGDKPGDEPGKPDPSGKSDPNGKPDDKPGSGGGKPSQPDVCGSFTAPAAAEADEQELRDDWTIHVHQAAIAADVLAAGDIPGDMQRELERMRHQTVDWRQETADFVRSAVGTRNDWSRSARRHVLQPVIYPRRRCDDVGTVIFARDTSMSISDKTLSEFAGLITDCVSEMGCVGRVFDCDARIQAEYEINGYEECPLSAKGGGGTSFRPVFDKAAELADQGEQIAGIVYLTDMWPNDGWPEPPDIATLWLATTKVEAPFGRTVHIED